ncbi:MAG: DUF6265 family protein [Candidatus Acidiferrales bacterium]
MRHGRFGSSCLLCLAVLVWLPASPLRQNTVQPRAYVLRQGATSQWEAGSRQDMASRSVNRSHQDTPLAGPRNIINVYSGTRSPKASKTADDGRQKTVSLLSDLPAAREREEAFSYPIPGAELPAKPPSSANAPIHNPSRAPQPTLSDFAWLEGKWRGVWGPRIVEQIWTAPQGGQVLGLFRVIENDKTLVIELLSLSETPDSIALRLRHFTPALLPWEQSGFTTMKLVGLDTATAEFENPADGQPRREVFTRIDPDTYTSKSEIAPEAGAAHVTEIRYHRQK